jgi:hypothetical protein
LILLVFTLLLLLVDSWTIYTALTLPHLALWVRGLDQSKGTILGM